MRNRKPTEPQPTPPQVGFGTTKDRMIIVEGCPNLSAVTLFLRAGNKVGACRRA
jgi:hypothetical protein